MGDKSPLRPPYDGTNGGTTETSGGYRRQRAYASTRRNRHHGDRELGRRQPAAVSIHQHLADSYRITKVVTPTGGEMTIDYEEIPKPDTTWVKHINFDEAYFDRSRRLKRRIWDADGPGPELADTTTFNYIETASVMETSNANRLRRITFPIVDEILPGGHGKIRRNFVGESDLNALGLSATNKQHESERDIRRGLLEDVTYRDASGTVVQRQQTDWQVTTQGTWTGAWQSFYHPGIPRQAYWLRAEETTTTKDGVSTTTQQTHNARNGLVASHTLKSRHPHPASHRYFLPHRRDNEQSRHNQPAAARP